MGPQALAGLEAGLLIAVVVVASIYGLAVRRRIAELELALQRERASALAGRLVVVNTPRPDDQSIRGVVERELADGLLVLHAAVYLERELERGRETVREVPAGDVVVAGPRLGSWVQVLPAGHAPARPGNAEA